MTFHKPRHDECLDCRFFDPNRIKRRCLSCGSGEFFEERFDDRAPDETELMKIYAGMGYDEDN